ncbi:hypothetical protein GCM10008985_30470 [Halococcus dombrowskii]|uniref:GH26 domain-containing protein n=1 Tax=Halococcus dombrowskii TaxID=179637 RepID=A0AAV3SJL3_HALDO
MKVAGTVGILSGSAENALAQQSNEKQNELLVGVAPSANARQTAQQALPSEARIIDENDTLGYVRAELPDRSSASATASVASSVASRRGVEYAERNAVYEMLAVPNDPRFGDQYAPEMVNAPAAWETTFGESDVTVAVVDQGIKYDHPDLETNVADGYGHDFVDNDDDPYPDTLSDEQHGTHVAGIVASGTDNNTGIAGISNATLLSVRTLDKSETGSTADIADGIQWAADNGADIINLSLGGGFTETLQKAVSYAHEKGALLVAAAGNDGGPVNYPAAYDECLAVSALDPDDSLASYSSKGPEIELAAPGTNLLSTWTDDGYETLSGTSMAAPVVSGIAALTLSRDDLSNEEVRSRLKNTAVDVGLSDDKQGTGQVSGTAVSGGNILSIQSTGSTNRAEYRLTVERDLTKSTANGADRNSADTISGQTASGHVSTGLDSYSFVGKIERFGLDGTADVFLNGDRIDPANYPSDVLSIRSNSGTDRAEYQLTVEKDLAKSTANGADRNSADTISEQTASGHVSSGLDSYVFSGNIEQLSLDGTADVLLNGDKIDPSEYPDNVISIRSNAGTDRANYRFTVESGLEKSTANGADRNSADTISEQTASGHVSSGLDSYTFSGKIERFDLDGTADVLLNGDWIDPANYSGNVLSIESTEATDRAEYRLSVESELEKSTANGADRNSADTISGQTVSGHVSSGLDSYTFSGKIERFDLDGTADVFLNGDRIDPENYSDNVLSIESTDDTDRAEYRLTVERDLTKSTANGADRNSADTISGQTASGHVSSGLDSYSFVGKIERFDLDGTADVFLNGDRIDPANYPSDVLSIQSNSGTDRAEYQLTVERNLVKSTANGADRNSADTISGQTAAGHISTGLDSYAFSGGLKRFSMDGSADVLLNGDKIDPSEYPDNVISIRSNAGTDRANYRFTVESGLEKSTANGADRNGADTISGQTASGHVSSGLDSYTFSGKLRDITVDGSADVLLNDNQIDPADYSHSVLSIESNGGRFWYEFTVESNLEKSTARDASIDDNDSISGNTANGQGGGGGTDSYTFSGKLRNISVDGDATVYLNGNVIGGNSPAIGIHNGLSDANFDTINRMDEWQNTDYAVQNLFVPWNSDKGHMNWLFDHILPKIWNAGRTPLITWEPYTPGAQAASIDTQSLVEKNEYDAYLEGLADTTPNDIEIRIGNGNYDRYIDRWADRLRSALSKSGDRRAYLRLAHEMNGDWYPWSPTVGNSNSWSYVKMWRRVHNRFNRQGIGDDLQWMWCVNAEDVGSHKAEQLYPGNRYVDWLGLDGYNWGRSKNWSSWDSPESIYGGMLDRLSNLSNKPICVAEFASSSKVSVGHDPRRKGQWIRDALAYFENRGVDMWCWFNEDKETDWAVFNGKRGTERVRHNGRWVNAYSAYREAIDTYATISGSATAESSTTEQAVSDD